MAKIFIVDDDREFLESFKEIPFENAECYFFEKPMDAIKRLAEIVPDIIISDIQMPDIHGINFGFIATQITNPKCFILISANSKDIVEEKYSTLNESVFFKKPLERPFFDFLIEKIAEIDSVPEAVIPLTVNPGRKYENIRALATLWKEFNQIYYDSSVNHLFLYPLQDSDAEKLEKIAYQIDGCKKLLGYTEGDWQKFCSEFAINNETWYQRVLGNIDKLSSFNSLNLKNPCYIQHELLDGNNLISRWRETHPLSQP